MEPPFWWQGFKNPELQLLVYGPSVANLDASIDYPGITLQRTERVASENYLFLYLRIDRTANPGTVDIVFRNGDVEIHQDYEIRWKNQDVAHTAPFDTSDAIYLITPDRFANGDPGNDVNERLGDAPDRNEPYGRHGGDLAGIENSLNYIHNMGFTQIWLNPVLENAMPESSYHGYATTDFYKVDPRYGDNEQYRKLIQKARSMGIGMIMDMIANHIGSEHWWMRDLPTSDWLNSPDEYRQSTHMRVVNQDPHASEFDKAGFADGWFVPTMPDLNQRNPLLADYLIQNAIWWIEYLGLAGIRMDTWPYPDKTFMSEWSRRILYEYPHFNMVGEEWSLSPAIVSYWQRGKQNSDGYVSHVPSMMDFPVQAALTTALTNKKPAWNGPWAELHETIGHDFLYPDPYQLVIFPDNHDMSRIYTQLDEDYDLYRMAMVFYTTMRGIPQFYYGDEILMSHPGTESHGVIRSDFPGGWDGDTKNAFSGRGLTSQEQEAQALVRKLLNWRREKTVIHSGRFMHYAPIGNVYTYFRYDDEDGDGGVDGEAVMVIMNLGKEPETLTTSRFSERLGGFRHATDVISGRRFNVERSIVLEPKSVLLLELER